MEILIYGWLLALIDYSIILKSDLYLSVIIGLILGELVEGTLRQSLVIFDGNWLMFLTRPIALTFFILSLIALAFPLLRGKKLKIKN